MEQQVPVVERLGGSIVAIAVTATFSQQQFASDLDLHFPLLSDWGSDTADAWGVRYDVWKGHAGLAKRSVFVIDRDGIVRYRWVTDDAAEVPDFAEAVAAMAALTDGEE